MASVGQELLDVPLPDMVTKLALGIAEAQRALDENSVETAQILADTTIEVVPALTHTISAAGEHTFEAADAVEMSLLQVGLNPAFYQFAEASI
jgi:ribonuclease PH